LKVRSESLKDRRGFELRSEVGQVNASSFGGPVEDVLAVHPDGGGRDVLSLRTAHRDKFVRGALGDDEFVFPGLRDGGEGELFVEAMDTPGAVQVLVQSGVDS